MKRVKKNNDEEEKEWLKVYNNVCVNAEVDDDNDDMKGEEECWQFKTTAVWMQKWMMMMMNNAKGFRQYVVNTEVVPGIEVWENISSEKKLP